MDYIFHVVIVIGCYALVAQSLNLVSGYTGLLTVAQASFYGIGAYSYAILCTRHGATFVTGAVFGLALSAALGCVLALLALRLRGDFFVLMTLAFHTIVYSVFNNWPSLTGGPIGFSGIPAPSLFGVVLSEPRDYAWLSLSVAILGNLVVIAVVVSPTGRVLRAIRQDEVWAQALGKNVVAHKVFAFAMASGLAGLAGAVFGSYSGFVDPTMFTVLESVFMLSIVIVGGAGTIAGPIVGAVVLVVLPEALRFLGVPGPIAGHLRQVLYGLFLIAAMLWRPRGIIGRYGFDRGAAR